ncbi:glyoxalase/bleomycin resistance/dioxygenase family protein [Streptosporangium sp. NPDC050280]|uniref:glyoxalase/bleomycin resistance/dioxygenase family protein n=1 Tax=unclassified Streptosporangium TaxID=2632669 RepID=UPI003436CA12
MIHASLIVIYTDQLDACHGFYSGLGLTFAREQHAAGPEHYATTLGGTVFELYPATSRRPATGSLRIGFTAPADAVTLPSGRHVLTDPDDRVVELYVHQEPGLRRS